MHSLKLASGTLGCCDAGGSEEEWCISLTSKPRLTNKLALMPTSSAWPVYLWTTLKMEHLLYFSSVDHSFWIIKKKKTKHSMFVETVSLLKHFWKAWKHFEELCTAPEFPSFSSGFLCPFILLTTCNHCQWWCDVGFVPRAISSASSETDNWSACFTTIEHFFGVGSTAISGQHLPNPVE